jgi:hypothetical protein
LLSVNYYFCLQAKDFAPDVTSPLHASQTLPPEHKPPEPVARPAASLPRLRPRVPHSCHLGHLCYDSPSKFNLSAIRSGRPALQSRVPHNVQLHMRGPIPRGILFSSVDRSGRPALSPDTLYATSFRNG